MPAKVELTEFGVVIVFPYKANVDTLTFLALKRAGFQKAHCLSFNHWRKDRNEYTELKAREIAEGFNKRRYGNQ